MEFLKKTFRRLTLEFLSKQFFIFLSIGILAAIVNFVSRFYLNKIFSYSISILIAYIIGIIMAFLLQKGITFAAGEKSIQKQFSYFIIINVIGMVETFIVSLTLAKIILPKIGNFEYNLEIAHLAGLSVPMFTSFIGYKYLSFGKYNFHLMIKKIFNKV